MSAKEKTRQLNLSRDEIFEHLDAHSREPFKVFLGNLLSCAPTPQAIQAFADKSPDKYSQALVMAAKLTGYREQLDFYLDTSLQSLANMSTAELAKRAGMDAPTTDVVDADFEDVTDDVTKTSAEENLRTDNPDNSST